MAFPRLSAVSTVDSVYLQLHPLFVQFTTPCHDDFSEMHHGILKDMKAACKHILKLLAVGITATLAALLVKSHIYGVPQLGATTVKTNRLRTHFQAYDSIHTSSNNSENSGRGVEFTVRYPLSFAHSKAVRPLLELLKAPWVETLQAFLSNLDSKQVNIVVADSKFLPNVINWLISALVKANPSLSNVLVIALDRDLHTFLHSKGLASLHVDPYTVIQPGTPLHTNFSHIWITRCTIFRLLNHWGYDVITYDTDAVVLKNLQPLFDEHWSSDVIGSSGTYPFELHRVWGQTLCMGVALFRSTEHTELLWEAASKVEQDTYDDQVKINYALNECVIQWHKTRGSRVVHGECKNGLKVTTLPTSVVCRHCSTDSQALQGYYVWHQHGARTSLAKVEGALRGNAWFLHGDWDSRNEGLAGIEWLRSVSNL